MTTNNKLDIFEKLVSNEQSDFLSKFAYYEENQSWLDRSSEIAVNILEALRDKNMSQKDLAKKIGVRAQQVSKIVKGQQNMTLETICKLEEALNISLINIIDYKSVNDIAVKPIVVKTSAQIKTTIISSKKYNDPKDFNRKQTSKDVRDANSMTIVYKAEEKYLIAG